MQIKELIMTHPKINLLLKIYRRISWAPDMIITLGWFRRQTLSFVRFYFCITLKMLKSAVIKLCHVYFWFHSQYHSVSVLIMHPSLFKFKFSTYFGHFCFLVHIFTVDKHIKTFKVYLQHVKTSLCNNNNNNNTTTHTHTHTHTHIYIYNIYIYSINR